MGPPALLTPDRPSAGLATGRGPTYGELLGSAAARVDQACRDASGPFATAQQATAALDGYELFLAVAGRHLRLFAAPGQAVFEGRSGAQPPVHDLLLQTSRLDPTTGSTGAWDQAATSLATAHDLLPTHVGPRGEQRTPDRLLSCATPVLVEGPLDAVAVDLANRRSSPRPAGLAPCGSALTREQVQALMRVSHAPVVVAFDADPTGGRAAAAAYHLLIGQLPSPQAARLPVGVDPADLVERGGGSALRGALEDLRPLADRVVDDVLGRYRDKLDNAEARVSALREAAAWATSPAGGDMARLATRLTAGLGLDHATVTRQLVEAAAATNPTRRRASFPGPPEPRSSTTFGSLPDSGRVRHVNSAHRPERNQP